ncbi:glycosyltransferase family 2 protein [Neoroseomonas soli]|uniref:Glycosyltransferase n=1 Tax=Neoroseomonas soli TaxID=1081025 RepID=A0A9X9WZT5_9PROT|nr:glycosyltransferase family 2 protein [Neoroseomonas soli]MBR0672664.1 glycosyltransferase [Neoroseomonas soli]
MPSLKRLLVQVLTWVRLRVRRNPRLREAVRPLLRPLLPVLRRYVPTPPAIAYEDWIADYDTLDGEARARIRAEIAGWTDTPLMSVVLSARGVPDAALGAAIASVCGQLHPSWEICVAHAGPPGAEPAPPLVEAARKDARIRFPTAAAAGDVEALTAAIAIARGQWVILMDGNDRLAEQALFRIAREALRHPDAALIYSDEDRIDAQGRRGDPHFKPDFDPELLLAQDYFGRLLAYRRDVLAAVGGLRADAGASACHDLALRAVQAIGPAAVRHIPAILCHVGGAPGAQTGPASATAQRVVQQALAAAGSAARAVPNPLAPALLRIVHPVPEPEPLVSIIIPTRDRAELLRPCMEGILHRTDYRAIEVLVADNGSTEPDAIALLAELRDDPRVRVLEEPGPFNYSRINNRAVAQARGEILLLLNNDIEVIEGGWLGELVSHAVRPEIGAVGAKLLYPDGTVQHAGVLLGLGWPRGVAGHIYLGAQGDDPGPFGQLAVTRSAAAVTAACLAVRRTLYDEVGGLDEQNLTVAFNDVDFCLRLHARGYRNLWTPFSVLFHKESASRGDDLTGAKARRFQGEIDYMRSQWAELLDNDPYWNPNLSLTSTERRLAEPPRVPRP